MEKERDKGETSAEEMLKTVPNLLKVLGQFSGTDLLIADKDIIAALERLLPDHLFSMLDGKNWQTDLESLLEKQHDAPLERVVVMLRKGELKTVRRLRSMKRSFRVQSLTYTLLPTSFSNTVKANTKKTALPPVFVGSYGADMPYFIELLKVSKLVALKEPVNRFIVPWLSQLEDLHAKRFLNAVIDPFRGSQQAIFLSAEVLSFLASTGDVTKEYLQARLEDEEVKLVYLCRRNKCLQAAVEDYLEETGAKSLWEIPQKSLSQIQLKPYDRQRLEQYALDLVLAEAELESLLPPCISTKIVTIEEAAECPREVVEALSVFLQTKCRRKFERGDYYALYHLVPGLMERAKWLKADLLDSLGVTVNEHGSYVVP